MKDIEDLPDDVAHIAKRALATRQANAELMTHLGQIGATFDIAPARMEHLMSSLVDAGVVSDEQMWAINLDWEESLQNQLRDAEQKIRERIARQRYEERKAVSEIIKPAAKKLIVPGQ